MEEDIKTIENIIDTLKFHIEYENYEENILDECKRDIKALENLLKRHKKLEEENKKFKKDILTFKDDSGDYYEITIEEIMSLHDKCCELEEEVESQDKTIDKLVEEQQEREKYVHSLEEENAKLRIDNTEKLCEECSELAKEVGITEEDTSKILKDYRDKVENSIPISVIQNTLEDINKKEKEELKGLKGQDRYFVKQMYQYMKKPLQELLEERNK